MAARCWRGGRGRLRWGAWLVGAAPVAVLAVRARPAGSRSPERRAWRPDLRPFRSPRLSMFTVAAVLAYGAVEAVVVHRVARFQELGFGLQTVALWAGISGLLT